MTGALRVLDGPATSAALSPEQAVAAIREVLANGFDPATDPDRQSAAVPGGEMLIMPSHLPGAVGIKVLTLADRAVAGVPRIQGQYLLFDGATLSPRLMLDGAALTTLRTPAVSFAPFLPRLSSLGARVRVTIFGAGPQARAHAATLRGLVEPGSELDVSYVSRTPQDLPGWVAVGSPAARAATRSAQIVVCTTSAREPVVTRDMLRDDAIVVAVGSHSPTARELGSDVMADADVIVEDSAVALRECGDVVLAIDDGVLARDDLIPMRDVVNGRELSTTRPTVFKTAGMSWQDLVLADAIARGSAAEGEAT